MKRYITPLLLCFLCTLSAVAQKITVSGTVVDAANQETLIGATVVLMQGKDSTQVVAAATNLEGKFTLPTVKKGTYTMRVSYIGYLTLYRDITLSKGEKTVDVGTVSLNEDAQMMKETEVTARMAQMEMKADTFVYNAEAFRLPEGSALEELVRKLPGAEVDDDGNIKINGKSVSKIMVDGKEFFSNDTKMAMKNLPSKMVKKLKAYDKKSDYSRITGIDDGEEETVLDLSVKKGMKEGWLLNTDVGYGTEDRYTGKVSLNRFDDHFQFSLMGSANNINDRSFPGGGGGRRGGGGGGITTSQMAGVNVAWENGLPDFTAGLIKAGGNVRYSHSRTNAESKTNSETFLDKVNSTFSNSMSNSLSSSSSVDANFRVEWMPDSLTSLMLRPNFSHSQSHNSANSHSVTFDSDPYDYLRNPLDEYNMEENRMVRDSIAVNDNVRTSRGESHSNSVDADAQVNRRLGVPGRNLTLNLGGAYRDSDSKSFSRSEINYYRRGDGDFNNQYNLSPSKSYNYQARLSYTEPILEGLNLQLSYQFQNRFSDNDRSMYSIDSLLTKFGGYYTREQLYLGYIPGLDSLNYCRNIENSQYATYREYNHAANVMFRYNVGDVHMDAGVSFQPQTTHMDYAKNLLDTTVVRHTFNWAPRVNYRWKINETGQLRIRYNARMSQPSMTDLLEVTDSSDPLNISTGNAGLRSSWANSFNAFYNGYEPSRQMGWSVNANWNQTKNQISSATIYNTETGARYTRPMNINGNWNSGGRFMFNSALGPRKQFNVNTFTNLSYAHNVGYLRSNSDGSSWGDIYNLDGSVNMDRIFRNTPLGRSTTRTTDVGEDLRLNFRNDLLEVGVNGGFNYQHARNAVQENANLDSWNFNYGGNVILNLPWNMNISTDISEQSRRGYDDASMNTNELIWNAQISQSFLKQNAATVSVQWFDILHERSSISRMINATMRRDTWTNAIHSYVMVHFIYRLNLMGSREVRREGFHGGPDGMGGPGFRGEGGAPRGGMGGPGGRNRF